MTKKNLLDHNKPLALLLLSGILLGLAWPTKGFSGLIFIALVPLLLYQEQLMTTSSKGVGKKVFWGSYLSFVIWNTITTWWIFNATAFGMFFAILVNSSFYSGMFWLYHQSRRSMSRQGALIFWIALWLSFEKFHLNWDFSWPWLQLGNVFSENIRWIQWYAYTGIFGGSLWVLLINCGLFSALLGAKNNQPWKVKTIMLIVLGIGLPIGISNALFHSFELAPETEEILLLQPNEDPYLPNPRTDNKDYIQFLDELVSATITENTRWIITPEGFIDVGYGTPNKTFDQSPLADDLQAYLKDHPSTVLLTGIQLYDIYRTEKAPTVSAKQIRERLWVDIYNSAAGIQAEQPTQIYHKSKLVVGVEQTPFKSILEPLLGEILLDFGGMVSDRATQEEAAVITHQNNGYKAAPIICYESIYGAYVTDYVRKGAHFLAIITNDAWWGNTAGHRQLLSYARLRAIETRRDLARSANTGISAFINARGEIKQSLPYGKQGVLKGKIAVYDEQTFYVRSGDYIARIAVLMMALYGLAPLSKRFRSSSLK